MRSFHAKCVEITLHQEPIVAITDSFILFFLHPLRALQIACLVVYRRPPLMSTHLCLVHANLPFLTEGSTAHLIGIAT